MWRHGGGGNTEAVGRIFHTASNIEVESLPITSERIGEQMMRGITLMARGNSDA